MRYVGIISCLLAIAPTLGQAQDNIPLRKPGLWEVKISSPQKRGKAITSQQCIDENTDSLLLQRGLDAAESACSQHSVRMEEGHLVAESVCRIGNSTATTRAVFSGNFGSDYRGEIHTTYNPPMTGMKESRQQVEARWLGPCKPGQNPGDVIMPGAGTFNLPDLIQKLPYLLPR